MAGYLGTTPVPQSTQHREAFTATASQTSFATVGYTPQFVDVYLNGVKLAAADYTATNGSDIVLTTGAALNDILEYVAYTPFEVASQTFTGTTTTDVLSVTGAATGTDLTLSGGLYVGGSVAANYLDDYEEGTWTPIFSDGTNSDGGASVRSGSYTKIGNKVHAQGRLAITSLGSMSGGLRLTGLPFTASGGTSVGATLSIGRASGLSITAGQTVTGYVSDGQTYCVLNLWDNAGGTSGLSATELSADGDLSFTIDYLTA